MWIEATDAFVKSFVFSASLIVGLGPSNIFIIRQGLRRNHVGLSSCGCVVVDLTMVVCSLFFFGELLERLPALRHGLLVLSSVFLVGYIVTLVRSAVSGTDTSVLAGDTRLSAREALVVSLSLGLMNPAVWLDMLFLVGGYLQSVEVRNRPWAALGACATSAIWFPLLGYSAARFQRLLNTPHTMRIIELGSACVLASVLVGMWRG